MSVTAELRELRGKLNDRRDKAAAILSEAGPDLDMDKVTSIEGDSKAKVAAFQALQAEMTDLAKEIEPLTAQERSLADLQASVDDLGRPGRHPGHGTGKPGQRDEQERKSLGQQFVESDAYKAWNAGRQGQVAGIDADWLSLNATTFDTAGSTLTGYDRQPGIVLVGTQRLTVANLLATGQTTQNTIRYVQEDTYTNAATAVAEGAAKPEAAFDTSEVDAPVRKIAVVAKVTDEMFADFPMMQSYIDQRLRFMVAQTEETQLLNGNGTPPNIRGILQTSGIQTQARGSDDNQDAIYKAMIKVRSTGFFEPDGVVVHPDNWTTIRLLRTSDGEYIWGLPSDPGPERVWGLPTVVTVAIATGTSLVGAFQLGAQVFYREGIRVESTNSNEDDFKKNLVAIRAEQREALAVYRPKAFCTVTSMQ